MLTTGILGKLHRDHDAVSRLMTDINELVDTGSASWSELFAELKSELLAHCRAEDAVLYGALEQHDECREDVRDGREEHDEIAEILTELERIDDEEEWLSTFQELEEAVEYHVREVEGETFSTALRLLGRERLEHLAEAFQREKARFRSEVTGRDEGDEDEGDGGDDEDALAPRDSLTA